MAASGSSLYVTDERAHSEVMAIPTISSGRPGSRARITDVGGQNDGTIEGQTPGGRRARLNQSWAATSTDRTQRRTPRDKSGGMSMSLHDHYGHRDQGSFFTSPAGLVLIGFLRQLVKPFMED